MGAKPEVIDDIAMDLRMKAKAAMVITDRMLRRAFISRILAVAALLLAAALIVRFAVWIATGFETEIGGLSLVVGAFGVQLVIVGIVYLMKRRNDLDGKVIRRLVAQIMEELERRIPSKN